MLLLKSDYETLVYTVAQGTITGILTVDITPIVQLIHQAKNPKGIMIQSTANARILER